MHLTHQIPYVVASIMHWCTIKCWFDLSMQRWAKWWMPYLHPAEINIVMIWFHHFPLRLMRALLSMGENIRMHISPQPSASIPKRQVITSIQSAHVASDHHSPLDLSCLLTASSHLMWTFNWNVSRIMTRGLHVPNQDSRILKWCHCWQWRFHGCMQRDGRKR